MLNNHFESSSRNEQIFFLSDDFLNLRKILSEYSNETSYFNTFKTLIKIKAQVPNKLKL